MQKSSGITPTEKHLARWLCCKIQLFGDVSV